MPSEIIKGEIVLNLFNSQNLLEVPNKPYLYVKLKRSTYTELGTKEK
jgi:predicted nucleic-acid-binding Zn-ribbon protein